MNKKLKWFLIIIVFIILILVGLKKGGIIGKEEGIKVTSDKVKQRDITEIVTASGKIYPEVEVKVSSDISGEIVALPVNEGDTVHKGQVVARIYADIYGSQRDQAAAIVTQSKAQQINSEDNLEGLKATLNQTEFAFNRQKKLLDDKVISRSEFETAQQAYLAAKANYTSAKATIQANIANVKSNQASLDRAQKDVDRTIITAPMDGIISLLNMKKGERIAGNSFSVGTEIMRIADLKSIEVKVDVGENDIPKVKLGDSAVIQVDAYNQRKFKGVVYKIANPQTSDANTTGTTSSTTVTNYQVHIRLLPNSYMDLMGPGKAFPFRPNMTASADIQTSTHAKVMSIPLNAVTTRTPDNANSSTKKVDDNADASGDDIQEVVFVLQNDGKVKQVKVTTGIQDLNYIEILSGLKIGDAVITGPYDAVSKDLKNATKVQVVTKDVLDKK
ncbi:efflux RND transporter periplasmic adaptor subunit [Rhizosphaericola mali]|uniref:Efflux RND transporter periplasmic adaptor subunit n=1 Tax=Rhizosphaericola mali TaxID=2545455 RepID=A0A5P2G5A0_9BACT|nr:efflux RND transporter periplasmic adaptor subunit [Rhizosphaericola mali]QES89319.1 efflux RND transporter periplasmic adaptor subunit [Rhizosphaericola mali]